MWGYGGNFAVILPNGVTAFRYADAGVHDPVGLARASTTILPMCQGHGARVGGSGEGASGV